MVRAPSAVVMGPKLAELMSVIGSANIGRLRFQHCYMNVGVDLAVATPVGGEFLDAEIQGIRGW
jgi:hypothetical protein